MRFALILLLVLAILVGTYGWLDRKASQSASEETPELLIENATLGNGLEVVVVPNDRVPAISHILWIKAGAIDEPRGASGVAHYLEHMLFKGTPSVPEGDYSQTITRLGGNHNAFTGHDFTG